MRNRWTCFWLLALVLAASSCGDNLLSGYSDVPGKETEATFGFSAKVDNAAEGDSLFIRRTFPFNQQKFFGLIQNGVVDAGFSRPVNGANETYTIWPVHKRQNGHYYPFTQPLVGRGPGQGAGTEITAYLANEWAMSLQFGLMRPDSVAITLNPLRDDRPRLMDVWIFYDGIATTNPDSLFLNDPATFEDTIHVASPWSDMDALPGEWQSSNRWGQIVKFLKPLPGEVATYYLRLEKHSGAQVFSGCYALAAGGSTPLRLDYIKDPNRNGYWVFAIKIFPDGTIMNGGAGNIWNIFTIDTAGKLTRKGEVL